MEEYIYSSEYYCEDCECYHSVSVFSDGDNFTVNDDDGDIIAKYSDYEKLSLEFPEGTPHIGYPVKREVITRWHVMFNSDLRVQCFLKSENPFLAKNRRLWISPKEAPEEVRLTLGLTEDDRIDPEIKDLDAFIKNLPNINGEQRKHRNAFTTVFSFDVVTFG